MLKQHSQFMLSLLVAADALAVAAAWLISYWLRFAFLPVTAGKGVPELADKYLPMLPLVVLAHLVIFYRVRLYRPRRDGHLLGETKDILKAFCVAIVAIVVIDYALPASNKISRRFILTYAIVGTTFFAVLRGAVRLVLRSLRRRGYNRRAAAIIGSGRAAQRLLHALRRNTWTGIDVVYFVDDVPADAPLVHGAGPATEAVSIGDSGARSQRRPQVRGIPVRGPLPALREILEAEPVDSVFIALPNERSDRIDDVLAALETSMADVRMVPEINPSYAMRPNISELDGVPILSLRQTPLYGWNALVKRTFDLVIGGICLLIAAVPMLVIAATIKLASPGPVFYRQRRMGLDGCEFDMLKFRTMRVNAEADTGAVWAAQNDPRRTRIGAFLRRTSLDELPNLFNVMAGQMSLVGPRPERPEFIQRFKHEIPRYMLRHKMKSGMTGFAQVRGLRGNTSLRKRIQHDVHYIRNWSLGLDIRILVRTVVGVWFSKHEA